MRKKRRVTPSTTAAPKTNQTQRGVLRCEEEELSGRSGRTLISRAHHQQKVAVAEVSRAQYGQMRLPGDGVFCGVGSLISPL